MTEVHLRMHALSCQDAATEDSSREVGAVEDPIAQIAASMVGENDVVGLLCFDEFQCNDIFTAVTLSKLFTCLIQHGTVVVSTSNRPPRDLNSNLL